MNERLPESHQSPIEGLRATVAEELGQLMEDLSRVDRNALTPEQAQMLRDEEASMKRLQEALALFD
ncbi:MAG: hypothetical protein KBD16_03755 [Candidatus Pacebacteria bacterium]|nr:hypothetical protein [Candidatus Paceibacterota bacterium]